MFMTLVLKVSAKFDEVAEGFVWSPKYSMTKHSVFPRSSEIGKMAELTSVDKWTDESQVP
jgi:hypothetical protein